MDKVWTNHTKQPYQNAKINPQHKPSTTNHSRLTQRSQPGQRPFTKHRKFEGDGIYSRCPASRTPVRGGYGYRNRAKAVLWQARGLSRLRPVQSAGAVSPRRIPTPPTIPSPAIDNHYHFAGRYACYLSVIGSWQVCLVVCVLSVQVIVIRCRSLWGWL